MSAFCRSVIDALKSCLPDTGKRISLHEPYLNGKELEYLKECIDTGWVSSVGKFVDRYEVDLAKYTGAKRAIAVVNGTAALQVCLKLVGVGEGDEVMIPALTFVATANAVSYCGAVPHFVDSEEKTLGIDPRKLSDYLSRHTEMRSSGCVNKQTGRKIKAVVPMHTFGHPVDMDPLLQLCREYGMELVEDASESLGSFYKGRHTGTLGKISALSFNGNKIITTGGGGAILTDDVELADLAKHITTTARVPHPWEIIHDVIGFNFRLPNINAALGCAQLEQLPQFLISKRALAERYTKAFENVDGVRFVTEPEFARSNYWLNTLLLDETNTGERDRLLEATNNNGIMTRPAWVLLNKLPMYTSMPRMDLTVAEDLVKRIINIPSSASLVQGL